MAQRIRLYDPRVSRFPRVLGLCQDNVLEIANYANSIQETLLFDKAAGDEGWQGTWAEVAFNVSQTSPFVTLPREIARLEAIVVCDHPVPLNNQFFEYLDFGNGRMSTTRCDLPNQLAVYARNNAITFTDFTNPPQYLRAYMTNASDVGKRVFFSGTDSNDQTIYSQDNLVIVSGIFLALDSPYVTSTLTFNSLTAIQKDITSGQVQIYQVDPTTGDEVLLLTMQPGETVASYRRYYFSDLPCSCCPVPATGPGTVQVKAIAKMEPVPVMVDTDFLILSSREAFIEEAMALRLQEADTAAAQQMALVHHQRAIRLLVGQSSHYNGINTPAVSFEPFGSAHLDKVHIGMV